MINILIVLFISGPWNGKAAAFTFTTDDGYREDNLQWKKIFDYYGYRFTIFVITNAIGREGRLTAEDINTLHNEGYEIASHSVSHPMLIKDSAFTIKYTGQAESAMIKIARDTLYLWSSLNENYKFYLKDSLYKYLIDLVNVIDNLPEYQCELNFYSYKFWFCESWRLTPIEWQNIKNKEYSTTTRGGISAEKLLYEIKHSKSVLESIIVDTNYECISFSYPFYGNDKRTRIILRDSGNYLCARSGAPNDRYAPPIGSERYIPIWDSIYLYEVSLIHADVGRFLWGRGNSFSEEQTRDSVRKYIDKWKRINAWIVILCHTLSGLDTLHLKWILDEIKKDGNVWVETFGKVAQYIRETHYTNDGWLWIPKSHKEENNNLSESVYSYFNKLYYSLSSHKTVKITIYDICGSRKKEINKGKKSPGSYWIDLTFLPNGVYFVTTQIDKKNYRNKIIVLN